MNYPLGIKIIPKLRCCKIPFYMKKVLKVKTENFKNNLILTEKNSTNTIIFEDAEFNSSQNPKRSFRF